MDPLILLGAFGIVLILALALPPALAEKSWKRFLIGVVLSLFGILLPGFFFLASTGMTPDWKGACRFGWVDCFQTGKLMLTPLVLWASLALYALEIYRVKTRFQLWLIIGIFMGALVTSVCCVFGFVCLDFTDGGVWFMTIPVYIALWYSLRAVQLAKAARLGFKNCLGCLLISLPFLGGGLIWSRLYYASLPDKPPVSMVYQRTNPLIAGQITQPLAIA